MPASRLVAAFLSAIFMSAAPCRAIETLETTTRAVSGRNYSFIYLKEGRARFVVAPPDRNDDRLLLAIPAGFVTKDGKAIGVYVADGEVHNYNRVNKKLGGAVKIADGKIALIDTKGGAVLTAEFLNQVARSKGGLFQQFTIVRNGKAASFTDQAKAVRRAIGKLKNGQSVVVESKSDTTLKEFGGDMVSLGVADLVYTDLGKWGESWLRDASGKPANLGDIRKVTGAVQANWIVIEAPEEH